MPLTLNELYIQTKHQYHLSMIAGETGIDHIMNWVYVSEDSSTHDFLKGGELIITRAKIVPTIAPIRYLRSPLVIIIPKIADNTPHKRIPITRSRYVSSSCLNLSLIFILHIFLFQYIVNQRIYSSDSSHNTKNQKKKK